MTPRHLFLEGRRPRRLVTTHDINHIETFVPAAGEAAGPPIVSVMIMRFDRTRDDRGGLAPLSYVVDKLNLGLYLGVKRLMHWA